VKFFKDGALAFLPPAKAFSLSRTLCCSHYTIRHEVLTDSAFKNILKHLLSLSNHNFASFVDWLIVKTPQSSQLCETTRLQVSPSALAGASVPFLSSDTQPFHGGWDSALWLQPGNVHSFKQLALALTFTRLTHNCRRLFSQVSGNLQ